MVTVQEINLSEFFCMCGNCVLIQLFIVYACYKMASENWGLGGKDWGCFQLSPEAVQTDYHLE